MKNVIAGKVAVVTGGASGIEAAHAAAGGMAHRLQQAAEHFLRVLDRWQLSEESRGGGEYALAVVMVTLATVTRVAFAPVEFGLPFVTYFPAVMLTAMFGSFWAGMLCMLMSSLLATQFFIPPTLAGPWSLSSPTTMANIGFIFDAFIVCIAAEVLRLSRQRGQLAAARLRESEQRFKTLARGTFEGVAVTSDGRFRDVNDQLAHMLGYERSELIGKPAMDIVVPEDRERIMANIGAGRDALTEHGALRKDGTRIVVATHGQTVLEDGRPLRLTAFQDITTRRQAEEAIKAARDVAERANAAKSRFLAAASHDLRQPLTALALYVNALETRLAHDDGPVLANLRSCVANLTELLSDLLDVSKLEAGVVKPNFSSFALD